jgi:hypothetical protein
MFNSNDQTIVDTPKFKAALTHITPLKENNGNKMLYVGHNNTYDNTSTRYEKI